MITYVPEARTYDPRLVDALTLLRPQQTKIEPQITVQHESHARYVLLGSAATLAGEFLALVVWAVF